MEELMNMPITDDDPAWATIGLGDTIDWDCDLLQPPITPRSPVTMRIPPTDIPTADSALTDAEIDRLFEGVEEFLDEPLSVVVTLKRKEPAPARRGTKRQLIPSTRAVNGKRRRTKVRLVTDRCTCKNSKCLKLYCVCYSAGRACGDKCSCRDCKNLTEGPVRSNKLQGCNCTRSNCQTGYCQCYKAGRKCTAACKCLKKGCCNASGIDV